MWGQEEVKYHHEKMVITVKLTNGKWSAIRELLLEVEFKGWVAMKLNE